MRELGHDLKLLAALFGEDPKGGVRHHAAVDLVQTHLK